MPLAPSSGEMCRTTPSTPDPRRAPWCALLMLACLLSSGGPAGAQEEAREVIESRVDDAQPRTGTWKQLLYRSVRTRRALEQMIGHNRSRELAELRYRIHRSELFPHWHFGPDVQELDWMTGKALSNFGKLVRESVLSSGPIGRWRNDLEQQADEWAAERTPDAFDLEAKIGVGSKRYLGVELGLPFVLDRERSEGGMSIRLQARHGLDTDRHLLRLRLVAPNGELVVDHRLGDGWHGAETRFGYRYEF